MEKSKFYDDYKIARDKSWEIIFKYKIGTLPVNIFELLEKMKIKVYSYTEGLNLIAASGLSQYTENDGFTYVINGKNIIFYNDSVENSGRLRFTLAHELGHIVMRHATNVTVWNRGEDVPVSIEETQANIFASRLLAPACVLHELDIHTADDIVAFCGLSKAAAKIRAERMEKLYEREREWQRKYRKSCFGISKEEQKAMKQFKRFCEQQNLELTR